jgi:hypothetical protein
VLPANSVTDTAQTVETIREVLRREEIRGGRSDLVATFNMPGRSRCARRTNTFWLVIDRVAGKPV